jgi:hypothetical protein
MTANTEQSYSSKMTGLFQDGLTILTQVKLTILEQEVKEIREDKMIRMSK